MGVSLNTRLNHDLLLQGCSLPEALELVQSRLDALVLPNPEFLHACALDWYGVESSHSWPAHWQFLPEDPQWYNFDTTDDKVLLYEGPYGLRLQVESNFVISWAPPYRYQQWFGLQQTDGTEAVATRNEWRRYLRQVARAFGGDRALYLPDSGPSPLAAYSFSDLPVPLVEQALRQRFGPPKATFWEVYDVPFREVYEGRYTGYFVDYFLDLPEESSRQAGFLG